MTRTNDGEWRKTTATSLRIVDAIEELDGATLSEISEHMRLSSSTLYTHLNTLEELGYVTKIGERYCLGLKLFHLGEISRYRDDRYRLAKEKAFELANMTNEEVSFAVEENGRSIILFDETNAPSREGYQVGRYFYMHNSASGKAMLAEFDAEYREEVLDRWGMPRETENTIVDRDELHTELERVRKRGYAVNDQEALEGLRSVGVAVKSPDGDVFGSLDVSGPPYRLPPDEELAGLLQNAVGELEASIGTK
ncbi:IclR family transcriptional regulator [Halobacterium noricense]|uniref:IclR family transcriptional regulator n=1 Tax=Halobacterium noricense TaxID=223182 RepID=UPI001E58A561|nr:IclR family transcriptional regulator [Halobacterium noricense]UHH23997.1 IclR family transcriptional regulator [Halobacterium noricense]